MFYRCKIEKEKMIDKVETIIEKEKNKFGLGKERFILFNSKSENTLDVRILGVCNIIYVGIFDKSFSDERLKFLVGHELSHIAFNKSFDFTYKMKFFLGSQMNIKLHWAVEAFGKKPKRENEFIILNKKKKKKYNEGIFERMLNEVFCDIFSAKKLNIKPEIIDEHFRKQVNADFDKLISGYFSDNDRRLIALEGLKTNKINIQEFSKLLLNKYNNFVTSLSNNEMIIENEAYVEMLLMKRYMRVFS